MAGTPTIGTLGGAPNVPTIVQRSYNHLAILKHHHNNNEHNYNNIQNIQHLFRYSKKINNNNNNDNNNTVSTTQMLKKNVLLLPIPTEVAFCAKLLYPRLQDSIFQQSIRAKII